MGIRKEDNGLIRGGVTINPTLADHYTGQRTTSAMKTFTIDTSKHYILVMTYRYNDSTYRTTTYYVADGACTLFGGTQSTTDLTPTLNGTSLSVNGGTASNVNNDLSLIQLD